MKPLSRSRPSVGMSRLRGFVSDQLPSDDKARSPADDQLAPFDYAPIASLAHFLVKRRSHAFPPECVERVLQTICWLSGINHAADRRRTSVQRGMSESGIGNRLGCEV